MGELVWPDQDIVAEYVGAHKKALYKNEKKKCCDIKKHRYELAKGQKAYAAGDGMQHTQDYQRPNDNSSHVHHGSVDAFLVVSQFLGQIIRCFFRSVLNAFGSGIPRQALVVG
jgi:hypothetical protein